MYSLASNDVTGGSLNALPAASQRSHSNLDSLMQYSNTFSSLGKPMYARSWKSASFDFSSASVAVDDDDTSAAELCVRRRAGEPPRMLEARVLFPLLSPLPLPPLPPLGCG